MYLTHLPSSAEFIVATNVKSPIKICGVAECRLRGSKKEPYRSGYLVFYEDNGVTKQLEINKELYLALHLVFSSLKNEGDDYFIE